MDFIQIVRKYISNALAFIIGMCALGYGLANDQEIVFSWAGGAITVFAILSFLLNADIVTKGNVYNILFFAILPIAGIFAYLNYESIKGKIRLENEAAMRREAVQERLTDIRTAQLAHRSVFGSYAGDFDALITFVDTAKFDLIKKDKELPDSLFDKMTIHEADAAGIVHWDTLRVSVRDSIFPSGYQLDSIRYVPFTGGKSFFIVADMVKKVNSKVPAFEATAKLDDIYVGLDKENIAPFKNNEPELKMGSVVDLHTNGNW